MLMSRAKLGATQKPRLIGGVFCDLALEMGI
jgi:hypothetical protein